MNRTNMKAQANSIETHAAGADLSHSGDAVYEVLSVTNLNANHNVNPAEQTVEVLYQRLGSRWYAFSMVGDEVYFSQVDASEAQRKLRGDVDQIDAAEASIEASTAVVSGQA